MRRLTADRFARRVGPRLHPPDVAAAAPHFSLGFGEQQRLLHVEGDGAPFRPAAVLVPVIAHAREATVLLTERCAHLPDHAGQISFPGGRMEDSDADAVAAALREAEEEVGLMRGGPRVAILGALDQRGTISNYRVTPIVAVVEPFAAIAQAGEVAAIFEVPLAFVLDPANHEILERSPADGGARQMFAIRFEDRFIFGFTARILVQLSEIWHGGRHAASSAGRGRGG